MFLVLAALSLSQDNDPIGASRAVLAAQVAAWNAGKLDEFVSYYDADAQFFSGGTVTKGRAAVLARYIKRYKADGKEMGKLTFSELQFDAITPGDVLVRGRWAVATRAANPSGLFTLVVRKMPAGWRVVHDHTSAAE